MFSNLRESCGIIGVYAPGEDVARLSFFGLFALQHRGQESAGIAAADGQTLRVHTAMGLVNQAFDEDSLSHLHGLAAIGHTRYSTCGSSRITNAQPIVVNGPHGKLALGHNGNIVNAQHLREEMEQQGLTFETTTDSEVIARLIVASPGRDLVERIQHAMRRLHGAYSLVLLTQDAVLAVRDPMGVRPLCLGRISGGWVVASETCALDHIGAEFEREVEPGEIVHIDGNGPSITRAQDNGKRALCIFEYIYFARPDSIINGRLLYPLRQAMGARLARDYPVDADLVIGIPDSATAAGVGYAHESGVPFTEALIKNRYVGRTFIQPDQRIRDLGVRLKFNPLRQVLEGSRIVVVDDSIVRGTTTPHVVSLLRRAGAREVHMRICAPPIRYPCFFGVDMATRWELIASRKSVEEIAEFIGADSLGYQTVEGLIDAVALPECTFCLACFTGRYPIPVQLEMDKLALESVIASPKDSGFQYVWREMD